MNIPKHWKLNADGTYDVEGSVQSEELNPFIEHGRLTVAFNKVTGDFFLKSPDLITLEGCPKDVKGYFHMSFCDNIDSLEYLPTKVGGELEIAYCDKLKSFKKCSTVNVNMLTCRGCGNLESLEGAPTSCYTCRLLCLPIKNLAFVPQNIEGNLIIEQCDNLENLEGAPEKIGKWFLIERCRNLKSLVGGPKFVGEKYSCTYCGLESLEGAPECCKIFNVLLCNSLKNLEGVQKSNFGFFSCSKCGGLNSLKGAPDSVNGNFECNNCSLLTNLKGAPKIVKGNFCCNNCVKLASFDGFPDKIEGDFMGIDCSFDKDEIITYKSHVCRSIYL